MVDREERKRFEGVLGVALRTVGVKKVGFFK